MAVLVTIFTYIFHSESEWRLRMSFCLTSPFSITKSFRFETIWGLLNYIFGWTIPLNLTNSYPSSTILPQVTEYFDTFILPGLNSERNYMNENSIILNKLKLTTHNSRAMAARDQESQSTKDSDCRAHPRVFLLSRWWRELQTDLFQSGAFFNVYWKSLFFIVFKDMISTELVWHWKAPLNSGERERHAPPVASAWLAGLYCR